MSCRAQTVRSFVQRRPIGKIPKEFPKAQFGSRETNTTSPAVLVTQEMIDEWEVQQEEFSIPKTPEGNLLKSAFSFMTTNDPPSSYNATNTTEIPVNWNGVTRILITPTMGGITEAITNQPVNGFKATMSALTLFGKSNTVGFTNDETTENFSYNNLVEYQGVSYTISVLTGDDLLNELKATYNPNTDNDTTKIVADALVTKNGTTLAYGTGSSLVLQQRMDDINTQYEGTYAVQDIGSKTEPIWESCIIGGSINKYVKASITNAGEPNATVDFSTSTDTINVLTSPATTGPIEIPILAMIRVDFPEDLIQELYTDQVSETEIKLSMMNVAGQLAVEIGYGPTA